MNVSVRELKNSLAQYLRRVQAGEELVVTSRGRRIAKLTPLSEPLKQSEPEADAIARLDAQPWIRPPIRQAKLRGSDRPLHWRSGQKTAEEIVRDIRD